MRTLNLSAYSETTPLAGVDLDFTTACNLRCTYCYKWDKGERHLSREVAFDVVVWALHAASENKRLTIALMGGEPLLNFSLLKEWVPFAFRRAKQENISLFITATTNATLITDEVIDFWKRWGLRFHTSIDGTPEAQNVNRPTASGGSSAHLVESGVIRILEYFPQTTARCTVTPASVGLMLDSYRYFRSLGYVSIAVVPSDYTDWDGESFLAYEDQLYKVAEVWLEEKRNGTEVIYKHFDDWLSTRGTKKAFSPCGAGNGLVSIDVDGNIWTCTRMTKSDAARYCLGSIYEDFHQDRQTLFSESQFQQVKELPDECQDCIAYSLCIKSCPAEHVDCIGTEFGKHHSRCGLLQVQARVGEYVYQALHSDTERGETANQGCVYDSQDASSRV